MRWRTANNRRKRPQWSPLAAFARALGPLLWPDDKAHWPLFLEQDENNG